MEEENLRAGCFTGFHSGLNAVGCKPLALCCYMALPFFVVSNFHFKIIPEHLLPLNISSPTKLHFLMKLCWTDSSVHPLISAYLTTRPPLSSFLSLLTVIAVFWLLSRCHEETTIMAPLCQSTSLPEECLFNGGMLWREKHNVLSSSKTLS